MLVLHTSCGPVHNLAFSPDGASLAASGWFSSRIHLWNTMRGESSHIDTEQEVGGLAFSPCEPAALAWSERKGQQCRIFVCDPNGSYSRQVDKVRTYPGVAPRLAFSADGRTLAATGIFRSAGDLPFAPPHFGVSFWDWQRGSGFGQAVSCRHYVFAAAFSPDGLLAVGGMDKQAHIWDLNARCKVVTLEHKRKVHFLTFCRQGRTLASASPDGLVRLWDIERAVCERTLRGQSKTLTGLACSPDGQTLAASSSDGVVRFWDAETGRLMKAYNWNIGAVWSVAFAPDGQRAAAGGGMGDIVVWDIDFV